MKIALIGSSGGHLSQLYNLKPFWENHERFWVTFNKVDAVSLLENERTIWCYHPTNRNIINLIKNTILAVKILREEKPDVLISTGAAVAVPFFYVGKLFYKSKTVYLEVYDRINKPTITGRLVQPITDLFFVQWKEMLRHYKKAVYIGSLL